MAGDSKTGSTGEEREPTPGEAFLEEFAAFRKLLSKQWAIRSMHGQVQEQNLNFLLANGGAQLDRYHKETATTFDQPPFPAGYPINNFVHQIWLEASARRIAQQIRISNDALAAKLERLVSVTGINEPTLLDAEEGEGGAGGFLEVGEVVEGRLSGIMPEYNILTIKGSDVGIVVFSVTDKPLIKIEFIDESPAEKTPNPEQPYPPLHLVK